MPTTSASSPSAVKFVRNAAASSVNARFSLSAGTSTVPRGGVARERLALRACVSFRSMRLMRPSVAEQLLRRRDVGDDRRLRLGVRDAVGHVPITRTRQLAAADRQRNRGAARRAPSSSASAAGSSTVPGSAIRRAKSVPRPGT